MISVVLPPLCFTGQSRCSLPHVPYLSALLCVRDCFGRVTAYYSAVSTKLCVWLLKMPLCSHWACLSSSSYGKRLDDPAVTSASTGTSSAGHSHLNSVLSQRYFFIITILFPHESERSDGQTLVFLNKTSSGTDRTEGSVCCHHLQLSRSNYRRAGDQAEAQVRPGFSPRVWIGKS